MLTAGEEELLQFGFTSAIHRNRARVSIEQLVNYVADKKSSRAYFDMEKQYESLKNCVPPYQLPKLMDNWKAVDVFMFVKNPEFQSDLSMFVKPLAMDRTMGKELCEMAKPNVKVVCAKFV